MYQAVCLCPGSLEQHRWSCRWRLCSDVLFCTGKQLKIFTVGALVYPIWCVLEWLFVTTKACSLENWEMLCSRTQAEHHSGEWLPTFALLSARLELPSAGCGPISWVLHWGCVCCKVQWCSHSCGEVGWLCHAPLLQSSALLLMGGQHVALSCVLCPFCHVQVNMEQTAICCTEL